MKTDCKSGSPGGAPSDVGSAGALSAIPELRGLYKAVHPVSFWI
jgi:hypothetical protein